MSWALTLLGFFTSYLCSERNAVQDRRNGGGQILEDPIDPMHCNWGPDYAHHITTHTLNIFRPSYGTTRSARKGNTIVKENQPTEMLH